MLGVQIQNDVEDVFRVLMTEKGTPVDQVDVVRPLYDGGYGLDSIDTATFSAMLADRFEDDPYSAGQFPQTIAQIIAFYSELAKAA